MQDQSNLHTRQDNLEKRIDSLERVISDVNVFLARLSAELLNLKLTHKGTPPALSPDQDTKSNKIRVHTSNPPDLQEETIIESYTFHQSPDKGSTSPSDLSSNKSFDLSSKVSPSSSSSWTVPFYRGERDAEVIWAWLDKVETYFKAGQATEDEKVFIATYHLKDSAYYWWKNTVKGSLRTWAEFCKEFVTTFMPATYLREAKFALMDLRQLESVKEYSSHFCRLVNRLPGLSEEDKLVYYVHGLRCNVRVDVDGHNPRTLEEAVRVAEMFETKKFGWS